MNRRVKAFVLDRQLLVSMLKGDWVRFIEAGWTGWPHPSELEVVDIRSMVDRMDLIVIVRHSSFEEVPVGHAMYIHPAYFEIEYRKPVEPSAEAD